MINFTGVKIALIKGDELLVIQRDDKPGLRFAGMWDFPGGGREPDDTPLECILREVEEELSIVIAKESIVWEKTYPAMHDPHITAYFMVANITDDEVGKIKLGDEGQGWKLMKISDFMSDPSVIEALKGRLQDFLQTQG